MITTVTNLDEAITVFIEGARIYEIGHIIEDTQMCYRALNRTAQGLKFIDEHSPNARDILFPLLDHDDDVVRATAASALLQSYEDYIVPILQDIRENSITQAYIFAGMILSFKEMYGYYGSLICAPDPRYPLPKAPDGEARF